MDGLIEYFMDKDNIGEIILIVIALIGLPPTIFSFFKWLRRFLSVCKKKISTRFKKVKEWVVYRRTIGKLVRLEIRVVPNGFLRGKSPENNPELKNVYRMIKDGSIKLGYLDKLAEFAESKDIKLTLNIKALEKKPPKPPNLQNDTSI